MTVFTLAKIVCKKYHRFCAAIMPPLLALATLGDATQIGGFLNVLRLQKAAKASISGIFVVWNRRCFCQKYSPM
jgi:hypothetical protein